MAVDPDVDLHDPGQRAGRPLDPALLAAIAAGGVLGAEARYALGRWLPSPAGAWPAATWWINVVGSLLLGALMVVLTELTTPHRLARPFLGVGVLGGFTTFSTYAVDIQQLLGRQRPGPALADPSGAGFAALGRGWVGGDPPPRGGRGGRRGGGG